VWWAKQVSLLLLLFSYFFFPFNFRKKRRRGLGRGETTDGKRVASCLANDSLAIPMTACRLDVNHV
jgi:hypothetical protein